MDETIEIQKEIDYIDVINLGFKEEEIHDGVYFDKYGYGYSIINLELTDRIFIYWTKTDRTCELVRIKDPETGNIEKRIPIRDFEHLNEIIEIFR